MSKNISSMPTHVGIILDGNRRWARHNKLPILEGHRQGSEVFKEIAFHAFERGVKYVSAFAFSAENWRRTEKEVNYLMNLVVKVTEKQLDTFHRAGIKIVILGRRSGLSEKVLKSIDRTEETTKNNTKGTLALCFNYGGQEELVDAMRKLVAAGIKTQEITQDIVAGVLYAPDVPPVDLLIRTSGEQRLSGFMLYRAAYAELYFIDKHWPDFTKSDLDKALEEYATRQRRFGK